MVEFCSIPYVRFDGKMSVKRRQEALECFNIPLRDGPSPSQTQSSAQPTAVPSRRTRNKSNNIILDGDSDFEDSKNGEFVNGSHADEASDDSFLDDDDDCASLWVKKSKGKGKAKAKTSVLGTKSSISTGSIPKVMLISLKAGSLGLNLTVANNVYL